MLKKLFGIAIVGVIAKVVLNKITHKKNDADLWAEATDPVDSAR
jgi:hypothetical protein